MTPKNDLRHKDHAEHAVTASREVEQNLAHLQSSWRVPGRCRLFFRSTGFVSNLVKGSRLWKRQISPRFDRSGRISN